MTIRDLLAHQSGLPPWRPLHLLAQAEGYEERKALTAEAVLKERPLFHRGGSVLYTDLGFNLL
ncbi:MAG: beta-lactamase family protein [Deltaproteobacteria bacterium]|nr:beta-lactamase family protein [Deltaproteobacteria bacterium]